MPRITLSDGSVREFPAPVTVLEVARAIGAGLARAAIGGRVDGELYDLAHVIAGDASIAIVTTPRGEEEGSADALYLLRHSCAHVMAEAIQRLIPEALLVYGPPLEIGFYYDIRFPEGRVLSASDFEAVEREMSAIVGENRPFTRYELPVSEGMAKLRREGSKYKLDNAERAVAAGSDRLSWYATGQPERNWEDLCRGPHLPASGGIGAFKLLSVASSYWHGDAASDALTRVYGTAYFQRKHLERHLQRVEEARKRDHRVIGKKLGLFHIDDKVGQGLILWKPKGAVIRRELEEFIRAELIRQGYLPVYTPHIGKLELYRVSGHFPYYRESQYPPLVHNEHLDRMASEGKSCADLAQELARGDVDGYLLRPMNCPHHIRIYESEPHSYRDLPIRLAEFGTVYRWEQSGELNGLTRVRGFTQDDAHLFCAEEQVAAELGGCLDLVKIILGTLGITRYRVRVGLRGPDAKKYVGRPEVWEKAEAACRDAAKTLGVPYTEEPGEAAFYGPKIDFVVEDVVQREWQLGTIQVDYNLPERFQLTYVGADNLPHRPVMIHRAPFGSLERFIGVLIEHFAGAFPLWLAPEQARVLTISARFAGYAERVRKRLVDARVRTGIDAGDERIPAKIRSATEEKIPYLLVVGGRDEEAGTVSLRKRGAGEQGAVPLEAFVERIASEIRDRVLDSAAGAD